MNQNGIAQMVSQRVVSGVHAQDSNLEQQCKACANGKACRSSISTSRTSERAYGIQDFVHSDVRSPIESESIGGAKYFVTFIDENSNWVTVYCLKSKSEEANCFLNYQMMAERPTGKKIHVVRSDRRGKYFSTMLQSYSESTGIKHKLTTPSFPHQNGIAELLKKFCEHLK